MPALFIFIYFVHCRCSLLAHPIDFTFSKSFYSPFVPYLYYCLCIRIIKPVCGCAIRVVRYQMTMSRTVNTIVAGYDCGGPVGSRVPNCIIRRIRNAALIIIKHAAITVKLNLEFLYVYLHFL